MSLRPVSRLAAASLILAGMAACLGPAPALTAAPTPAEATLTSTAAPEASPTPSPLPTGSAQGSYGPLTLTPAEPYVNRFEVTPAGHLAFGQTVTVTWDVRADSASLSYVYVTGDGAMSHGDSFPLDGLSGSKQLNLKPVDALALYVDFTLTATSGQHAGPGGITAHSQAPMACPYPWFFDNPPQWCPALPDAPADAVFQTFQNAHMIAVPDPRSLPDSSVTVLFTDHNFWLSYPTVAPASPNVPPSLSTSPPLLPDPAFYGLWWDGKTMDGLLRDAVGSPVSAAEHYQAHTQCEFSPLHDMVSECFLSLPDGKVIRLYRNGTYGRNGITWQEWIGPTQ
jgi:hypothetical protein